MTIVFIFIAAFFAVVWKKLTVAGGIAGMALATALFAGTGHAGILLLAVFFFAGILTTGWKKNEKRAPDDFVEQRTAGQVLANGGMAAAAGAFGYFRPEWSGLCLLVAAGSIAAATSDTLSSELGIVYGRRFYNILTFKADDRGLNGVVSLEGCLAGLAGSAIIAALYTYLSDSVSRGLCVAVAGVAGNLVDSLLGATLERDHLLGNNAVNFLNTVAGAFVAFGLTVL